MKNGWLLQILPKLQYFMKLEKLCGIAVLMAGNKHRGEKQDLLTMKKEKCIKGKPWSGSWRWVPMPPLDCCPPPPWAWKSEAAGFPGYSIQVWGKSCQRNKTKGQSRTVGSGESLPLHWRKGGTWARSSDSFSPLLCCLSPLPVSNTASTPHLKTQY